MLLLLWIFLWLLLWQCQSRWKRKVALPVMFHCRCARLDARDCRQRKALLAVFFIIAIVAFVLLLFGHTLPLL